MNKELTPLEALDKIDHTVCLAFNDNNKALFNKDDKTHIDCKDIYEFCNCYDIIETALKENIGLKKVVEYLQEDYHKLEDKITDLEKIIKEPEITIKKLKAFDIVSDKVCVDFFLDINNEYIYVLRLKNDKHFIQITKEQYNLLREELL